MNNLILALALLAGASFAGAVYTSTPSTSAHSSAAAATCCDPVPLCPPTDPKCSLMK